MTRKRNKRIMLTLLLLGLLLLAFLSGQNALAVSEDEVQAQVEASGKGTVAGNVLIWFLCAVAFLKVSQKIDSFMASIGVNVGHTGGSMLSDVLIVSRALSGAVKAAGHSLGGGSAGARSGGGTGDGTLGSFFQGGLVGMAGRAINHSAMRTATENKTATSTVQSDKAREAVYSAAHSDTGGPVSASAARPGQPGANGTGGNGQPGAPGTQSNTASSTVTTSKTTSSTPTRSEKGPSVPSGTPAGPSSGGASIPIPGGAPGTEAKSPVETGAQENDQSHPVPPSDPGITIHAAPGVPAERSESSAGAETVPPTSPVPPNPIAPTSSTTAPTSAAPPIPGAPTTPGTAPVPGTPTSSAAPQANEGASIPSGSPSGTGNTEVPIPQPVPQPDSGPASTTEQPVGNSVEVSGQSSPEPPIPSTLVGIGSGAAVSSTTETDASTQNNSTTESVSAPVSNHSASTVNAPGASPEVGPGAPVVHSGNGGTVLHTATRERTAFSTSRESAAQSVQKTHSASRSTVRSSVRMERVQGRGIGGAMFVKSLASGGSFANNIIGKVATGSAQTTGTISGDMASQALTSYMGYTAIGSPPATTPRYTDVEIGGGRISGIETAPGGGQSVQFTMYHTEQYAEPRGDYTRVVSADGTTWYKQYAQDTVDRKPYMAPDDTVAYKETIVKRMPEPPRRKDRI